jgi:hypothetical protein
MSRISPETASAEVLIQHWMMEARNLEDAAKQEDIGDEEAMLNKYVAEQLRKCIRDFETWAASQGAFAGSDITSDGREIAGHAANQRSEPGKAGVCGSIPQRSTTFELAQTPAEPHEATYLRGWNEGVERSAEVAESYPSSGEQTEHPVEYWIRRLSDTSTLGNSK